MRTANTPMDEWFGPSWTGSERPMWLMLRVRTIIILAIPRTNLPIAMRLLHARQAATARRQVQLLPVGPQRSISAIVTGARSSLPGRLPMYVLKISRLSSANDMSSGLLHFACRCCPSDRSSVQRRGILFSRSDRYLAIYSKDGSTVSKCQQHLFYRLWSI